MKWSIFYRTSLYILRIILMVFTLYLIRRFDIVADGLRRQRPRRQTRAPLAPVFLQLCCRCPGRHHHHGDHAQKMRRHGHGDARCSPHKRRPESYQQLLLSRDDGKSSAAAAACIRRRGASFSLSLALPHLIRIKSAPISQLEF